jgi:toxin CptA
MSDLLIRLQPSYYLALLLSFAHAAAGLVLWPLALPLGVKAAIAILLIVSLIYYLRKDALLIAHDAVVALTLTEEMSCILTERSGQSMVCGLSDNTFVAPYLTVINLQPVERFFMRGVVILPDSIDAEEFRRLRIWLWWKWKNDREKR